MEEGHRGEVGRSGWERSGRQNQKLTWFRVVEENSDRKASF